MSLIYKVIRSPYVALEHKLEFLLALKADTFTTKRKMITLAHLNQPAHGGMGTLVEGCCVSCLEAGRGEQLAVQCNDQYICPQCHEILYRTPEQNASPSSSLCGDNPRTQHFIKRLELLEARHACDGLDEIITKIRSRPKNTTLMADPNKLYEWLKNHNYRRHYDYVAYIQKQLGFPVCVFSREQREQLSNDFNFVSGHWSYSEGHNLPNYNYLIYKLCQHNGYTEQLEHIGLYRKDTKLAEYEAQWAAFCRDVGWPIQPLEPNQPLPRWLASE